MVSVMWKHLILSSFLFITGCSGLIGADYTYTHIDKNGASCSITVGSARNLQGIGVVIGKDCTLKATAESVSANEATAKAMLELVRKIPSIPVMPAP